MRIKKIKTVFLKEVLDTLRDRRTLLIMIVIPVLLYPGLMIFMNELVTTQQAKMEQKTINVGLKNVPDDSPLVALFKKESAISIHYTDKSQDVISGALQFLIEVPHNADEILKQNKTVNIRLFFDRSNDEAIANLARVRKVIDKYQQDILDRRLKQKSLSGEYIRPVEVEEVNLATKRKMGGFIIGRLLPMLMVFMVLIGSMYPAIDMTAGEKERGTLETILTSPATKTEIVIGKFITVTVIAMITGLLNMGSMMATFTFGILRGLTDIVQIQIPVSTLFIMIGCLIPLALFFAGCMMASASFARSYKEAQTMVMPFYLVATLPAMVSTIPGLQLEGFWLTLPIANVTLLFKELMLGVVDINHILIVFFVAVFYASVAIFLAVQLFGREEVLFGETSAFGLAIKRANIVSKELPDRAEAFFFVLLSMALLLYVAIPLQTRDVVSGLIITELLIFLGFPLLFASYLKLDLRKTFRLNAPSANALSSTILMAIGFGLTLSTLVALQNWLFPVPKEVVDYMDKIVKTLYDRGFGEAFLLLAVLPAVCEEVSFRGMVLSGMLHRSTPLRAILITAFFFAVFHLSMHRFPGVFLIGLGATYLVFKFNSIFTGMILHACVNGYSAFVVMHPAYDWTGILQNKASFWSVAGVALIAASIWISQRRTRLAAIAV
jgi:sodium transport system permease protein